MLLEFQGTVHHELWILTPLMGIWWLQKDTKINAKPSFLEHALHFVAFYQNDDDDDNDEALSKNRCTLSSIRKLPF
jgi:hypothetical protein